MSADPSSNLSHLREIGWTEWDPIGLLTTGEAWHGKPFADEYDSYLLEVAGDLRRGEPVAVAVKYLLQVEREHMGLGVRPGQEDRAEATTLAIQRYVAASA